MAVSAFKSTSKRGSFVDGGGTSSFGKQRPSEDAGRRVTSRRSRSVSAVSRSRVEESATMLDFLNKRDNPLFRNSSASPTDSEKSAEMAAKRDGDASGSRRGRSSTRSSNIHKQQSGHNKECVRSLSRIDIGRRQRSISREHYEKQEFSTWDDVISTSSLSEAEEKTIKAVFEQMKAIHVQDVAVSSASNGLQVPTETITDVRREYTVKLQQAQERARKLRGDLDIEERRSEELSRILKEMLPVPKCDEKQSHGPKRKASIERHKMSRRLAEEAMNYFDECVSISTFDPSDFSSPEDQFPSAVDDSMPRCNLFGNNNMSSSSVCVASDPIIHTEVGFTHNDTSFSFSRKSAAATHDLRSYASRFRKELRQSDDQSNMRSSYNVDDFRTSEEIFLFEKIVLRHRIESGCLLICDVRTF